MLFETQKRVQYMAESAPTLLLPVNVGYKNIYNLGE